MLRIREYRRVESLEEAYELNQKKTNRIIGGGLWMKIGDRNLMTAIDLSGLGLDQISETEEEFVIGCMATLRDLEVHPGLNAYTDGAVKQSVCHIVGVQFRNCATVGGSIYGRYGFSDVLTLLMGMDSYVELYKGGIVSLEDYAQRQYDRDIVVNIIVKKRPVKVFYEAVRITKTDLPVITCCAVHFLDKDEYRVCIGARPGRAIVVNDNNGILSGGVNKESIKSFSGYAMENVHTESNMRGSKEYRSHLVQTLTQRALETLSGEV